jgi:hypothetical protein
VCVDAANAEERKIIAIRANDPPDHAIQPIAGGAAGLHMGNISADRACTARHQQRIVNGHGNWQSGRQTREAPNRRRLPERESAILCKNRLGETFAPLV